MVVKRLICQGNMLAVPRRIHGEELCLNGYTFKGRRFIENQQCEEKLYEAYE